MALRNKQRKKNINLKQTVKFKSLTLEREEGRKMNKFILLGHASTDLNIFSNLMHKVGIEKSLSSQDKGMTAPEITQTILKAENLSKREVAIEQLSVSRVWDTLALDLFLANSDKRRWFWKDSEALPLLDYWKNIDEKLGFIFVYDDPRTILINFSKTKKHLKPKHLDKLLLGWVTYNRALLNFFYKNKDRALLLNNKQIQSNSLSYIQELSVKIGIDIKKINHLPISEKSLSLTSDNALNSLLGKSLFEEYPEVIEIYEELQAVANISAIAIEKDDLNVKEAFCKFINLQKKNISYKSKLSKVIKENEEQNKVLENNKALLEAKVKFLEESINKEKVQKEENSLLLEQLHTVQEELEKYYLSNQEKEKNKALLEVKVKSLEESINKEKAQKEENSLLLEQLHTVQEELEKYYLENKVLKEKKEQVKRYYGAGERLKNEFTYSLGREILKKVKSPLGLLSLPFFVLTIRSKYKKDLKNSDKSLPPIETYADAYEAQRAKQHLTYMLGETSINVMSNPLGLFVLPFKLKQTHNRFKKNRNK